MTRTSNVDLVVTSYELNTDLTYPVVGAVASSYFRGLNLKLKAQQLFISKSMQELTQNDEAGNNNTDTLNCKYVLHQSQHFTL